MRTVGEAPPLFIFPTQLLYFVQSMLCGRFLLPITLGSFFSLNSLSLFCRLTYIYLKSYLQFSVIPFAIDAMKFIVAIFA